MPILQVPLRRYWPILSPIVSIFNLYSWALVLYYLKKVAEPSSMAKNACFIQRINLLSVLGIPFARLRKVTIH